MKNLKVVANEGKQIQPGGICLSKKHLMWTNVTVIMCQPTVGAAAVKKSKPEP